MGMEIVRKFQRTTGIRDPNIDAWFMNQETYKKFGMQHPSQREEKPERERRSRSPLIPGPRKVKSEEELNKEYMEKWLDESYIHRKSTTYFFPDFDMWFLKDSPWGDVGELSDQYGRPLPRGGQTWGVGTMYGIRGWDKNASTVTNAARVEKVALSKEDMEIVNRMIDDTMRRDLFRMRYEGSFGPVGKETRFLGVNEGGKRWMKEKMWPKEKGFQDDQGGVEEETF